MSNTFIEGVPDFTVTMSETSTVVEGVPDFTITISETSTGVERVPLTLSPLIHIQM